MAYTRRRVVTVLSLLYLLALVFIAAYALHSSHYYALPIPNILSALAVALPPLAGLSLETVISLNEGLAAKNQLSQSSYFLYVISFLLIYESVLAALAGTHLAPVGGLNCPLGERWQSLFSAKSNRIQAIQDAFSCCGFRSLEDMAFPFPDARHGADTCEVRYERDIRCLEPWREEERKVAIMLLVIPIAVFVWKLAIFALPNSTPWMPSAVRLPGSDNDNTARRQIAYRDVEDRGGINDEDSLAGEVRRLNSDSSLAAEVEGRRVHPSKLRPEQNEWRDGEPDVIR